MKKRVWELDALRGICILGMVVVHFVYDLVDLYRVVEWEYPALFSFVKDWGGVLFLLISGICATLGSRSVRRGLIVMACGLVVSAVTVGMYLLDMAGKGIIIYFGVLHCLGACMILWFVLKHLPTWALGLGGAAMVAVGLWLRHQVFSFSYLIWMGFMYPGFSSSDYFPLLPYLGFFLIGAFLGRTLYKNKETLLPKVNEQNPVLRFFLACGKHSLLIYMLHQPILSLLVQVIALL
ncbi:MAG: DUF1624 domain-containing protein [Oscillospiraceae bacterium]|nr:DUF1624 domain-containing protein [Oscillospiraceae bacterium]